MSNIMRRCPECGGLFTTVEMIHNPEHDEVYRKRACISCGNTIYTVEFEVENNELLQQEWAKYKETSAGIYNI